MIEDMESFRLPRYAQIPNVGLYLEQVVRYVNAHLAPLGEPELTSSMVSNYVKQSLIPAPIKKTYPSEHLARLLDRFLEEYQRRREKEHPGAQQKSRK